MVEDHILGGAVCCVDVPSKWLAREWAASVDLVRVGQGHLTGDREVVDAGRRCVAILKEGGMMASGGGVHWQAMLVPGMVMKRLGWQ